MWKYGDRGDMLISETTSGMRRGSKNAPSITVLNTTANSTQCAFLFQPVNQRLNGRVSDALVLRQTVRDFADRAGSQFPVLLQDSCLSFGKTGLVHMSPTYLGNATTVYGAVDSEIFFNRAVHGL
jgi:hypothetical protein